VVPPASKNTEMRAQWDVILIATACTWAVGAGCASKKPAEEVPAAAADRGCADAQGDPQIESLLTQPASDWRLSEINRRMYQSLHALDVELRREQRLAECEHPALSARSEAALDNSTAQSSIAGGVAHATALRSTGRTASGGGGNGATAPKITPGSDNDIVARRLRKAAEQESDPALRAKLWKEYTDYIHGGSAR